MAAHFDKTILSLRSRAKADLLRTTLAPLLIAEAKPLALNEDMQKPGGPVKLAMNTGQPGTGPAEGPLRTIIVTADPHFRKSLRQFCVRLPEVEIVAEAENKPEALRLVAELKPHLALVNFYMPGWESRKTAPVIAEFTSATRVILFGCGDAYEALDTDPADDTTLFVSKQGFGRDLPREIKRVLAATGSAGVSQVRKSL
jgi:hypothetical protein